MSERYTKLFALQENLYAEGSPVVIAAGALLKDNQTGKVLAQMKLRSISTKTIKAVTVIIHPKDTMGKELGDAVEYQYLDLSERRDAEFAQKQPIFLPDPSTRAFSVEVKAVIFTDNSQWTGTEAPWEALKSAVSLKEAISDAELVRQYKLEFGEHNNCLYTEFKDIWYCDCGAINRIGEPNCHYCNTEAAQLQNLDWDTLRQKRDERLAAEKAAEEERIRRKQAEAKKNKKLILTVVPIAVVVIFLGSLGIKYMNGQMEKRNAYHHALEMLQKGEFDDAISEFEELGTYQDSAQQVENAKIAREKAQEEAMLAAIEKEKEDTYTQAKKLLKYGKKASPSDIAQARELLEGILEYKDSGEIYEHIYYRRVEASQGNRNAPYFYDEYGRVIVTPHSEFEYNKDFRPTANKSPYGTEFYHYDEEGRLVKVAREDGKDEIVIAYDDAGRIQSTTCNTYSKQFTKTTQYDYTYIVENGLVQEITIIGNTMWDGEPTKTSAPTVISYEYDEEGRVTAWKSTLHSNKLTYTYGYIYAPDACYTEEEVNFILELDDFIH